MKDERLGAAVSHFGGNLLCVWAMSHERGMTQQEATECRAAKTEFIVALEDRLAQNLPATRNLTPESVKEFLEIARQTDWTNKTAYTGLVEKYKILSNSIYR